MFSNRAALAAMVVLAAGAACSRKPAPRVERLAIPAFENLTGDGGLDWSGHGVQAILMHDLLPRATLRPLAIESARETPAWRATHVAHGYLTRRAGRLRLYVWVEAPGAGNGSREASVEGPAAEGLIPLGDALARALYPDARAFPTRDEPALRDYIAGLRTADPKTAAGFFEHAAGRDPKFGLVYLSWAERLAATGGLDGAKDILARARGAGAALAPIEQAQFGLLEANFNRDGQARLTFLRELMRLTPANADLAASLAETELRARRYAEAARLYAAAAEADPANVVAWNSLGYARAYAGDYEGAVEALREYQRLSPDNANALDSMGEISFHLGRFDQAERYLLESSSRNALFLGGGGLWKAACARLMQGDAAGAGAHFNRYIEIRRKLRDPLEAYRLAQWDYLCGRRKQARARIAEAARGEGEPAALAAAQLAIWQVLAGERDAARESARRAASLSTGASSRDMAAVAALLAQAPAAAGEWALRAEHAFPEPAQDSLRRHTLAYALLTGGHFHDAGLVLREILERLHPAPGGDTAALLAWAYVAEGRMREAEPLLARWPIPDSNGQHALGFLSFPRILELKGKLLTSQGRAAEAAGYLDLFRKYSAE